MKMRLVSAFMSIIMLFSSSVTSPDLMDEISFNGILSQFYKIIDFFQGEEYFDISEELDDFSKELSDLLNDYGDADYFEKLVIDTENNTIQKDEQAAENLEKYGINYSNVKSADPIVAVEALFDVLGISGTIDDINGKISAFIDQSNIELSAIVENNSAANEGDAYLTTEQLESELFFETKLDDGKITLTRPYQTKRLIIQTKNGKALTETYSADKIISDGDGYYILQFETEKETKVAFEAFEKESYIEYAVPDRVLSVSALSERDGAELVQSDRYKSYLKNNGKNTQITVAVLDTGVDSTHPFLKSRTVKGYDATTEKRKVTDGNGHGTHVAGIIADNSPSNVKIMPIKILEDNGSGTDLYIKLGIDFAIKNKVDIINMSLGGECPGKGCQTCASVKKAIKAGIKVVVSAGNETDDTKNYCPAKISDCITVASCSTDSVRISYFSNYGSAVDVTAPGEDILSCEPGGGYVSMSGTSMSAPFASAAVAMILTENPALSIAKTEEKLKSYCTDLLLQGWDKYSGEGIINFGIPFGDNVPAEEIIVPSETVNVSYFSKCASVEKAVYIQGKTETQILTDRSFSAESSNSAIAVFDGKYIVPKKDGKATITITLPNGKSAVFDVTLKKKEVWVDYAASKYEKGNGTKKNPYIISNAKQLAKFAVDMRKGKTFKGKYFKLSNDIDLGGKYWITAGQAEYNNGFVFFKDTDFKGVFDGANHKIKNMTVFDENITLAWNDSGNVPNVEWYLDNTGFMKSINGGTIKRLGIENAYCENYEGALLVYSVVDSTVSNCYTTGYSGGNGLFGEVMNYNVRISNCYSSATVCKNGIADWIYSSNDSRGPVIISNTFFCGEKTDTSYTNGSVPFASIIEGNEETTQTYLYNCFSTSTSLDGIGFASSKSFSNLISCYYNKENAVGILNNHDKGSNDLSAVSASFFKKKSNFADSAKWNPNYKWDFKNTWAIDPKVNSGYPYLKKMKPSTYQKKTTGTWIDYAASSFAGGNGTEKSPYLISTPEQLARIAYLYRQGGGENTYFKLINDIDLSAHYWFPIAKGADINFKEEDYMFPYDSRSYFYGNIDGNGKTVTGLKIKSEGDHIGFISSAMEGTIKNLNFKNAYVQGGKKVGIICGENYVYETVYNCNVSGTVKGNDYLGGITGSNCHTSSVLGSDSTAVLSIPEDDLFFGGIAGYNYGYIAGCTFTCSQNSERIGGIAGCVYSSSKIENCLSIGTKVIDDGYTECGTILTSYSIKDGVGLVYKDTYYNEFPAEISTDKLKIKESYSGFDFNAGWNIDPNKNGGFPYPEAPELPENEVLPTKNWEDVMDSEFKGGSGTKTDPYLIGTANQLAYLRYALGCTDTYKGKYFRLIKDIDLKGRIWNSKDYGILTLTRFYFDGNGKTISNMTCNNGAGLFNLSLEKGEIANLNLKNVKGSSCGIIANNKGKIKNCTVSGEFKGSVNKSSGSITVSGAAGICESNYGTVERCSVDVIVLSEGNGGGIASYAPEGTIKNCFVKGSISATHADDFVGNNSQADNIHNCLSIVKLKKRNTGSSDCRLIGDGSNLKDKSTYQGWDFDSIWAISPDKNSGYPYLRAVTQRKITYNLKGGKNPSNTSKTYIPGYQYTLPVPIKKNYAFDGWYTDSKYKNKVTVLGKKDSGDVKLYAKWKKAYNIIFYSNYGKNKSVTQSVPLSAKTKLMALPFEREGYTFLGWATSKNGKVVYKNKQQIKKLAKAGKTVKLYAKWKAHTYEILFHPNGGKGEMGIMDCQAFTYGKAEKLLKCTYKAPKGKVFAGWAVGHDSISPTVADKQKIKNLVSEDGGTVDFYAVWIKPESCTIYYNLNGGKMPKNYPKTYKSGTGCTLPKPTRKGYKFLGWYPDKTCEYGKVSVIKPWQTENVVLYAKWRKK